MTGRSKQAVALLPVFFCLLSSVLCGSGFEGLAVSSADDARGWHKVLPSAALPPGKLSRVQVAGRGVLLARLDDGTLAAATVVCPHRGEDLSRGMLFQDAIDCPLHHYLYDLRTGENRYPRNVFPADLAAQLAPLPLYPVKDEDGWIWVRER
jgi:nitrite reductase/ring-hydroxylating ferredoxin subunit